MERPICFMPTATILIINSPSLSSFYMCTRNACPIWVHGRHKVEIVELLKQFKSNKTFGWPNFAVINGIGCLRAHNSTYLLSIG